MIEFLARQLWASLLWTMRRPGMKAFQYTVANWLPPDKRDRAIANVHKQNRFARRIGLPLMRITVTLIVASVVGSIMLQLLLDLRERGVFDLKTSASATPPRA